MSDFAEEAGDKARDWWEMMTSLRQTMLNLLVAGLFHLTEQQLATVSRDGLFRRTPLKGTKLWDIADWYLLHLNANIKKLPTWELLEEIRHVANTVKHAQIGGTKTYDPFVQSYSRIRHLQAFMTRIREFAVQELAQPITAPLSGEDLFVTEDLLRIYAEGVERFFGEIALYFEMRTQEAGQ